MWDAVVEDVKNKSTLQQLDLLELLQSMRLDDGSDATTHLNEMETHFRVMEERRDALATMGHAVSESNFLANVLKSVPGSYRPTVQTIDTTQLLTKQAVASTDAIAMFIREARHRVILEQQGKAAGSAMYAENRLARSLVLTVVERGTRSPIVGNQEGERRVSRRSRSLYL